MEKGQAMQAAMTLMSLCEEKKEALTRKNLDTKALGGRCRPVNASISRVWKKPFVVKCHV